MQDLVRKIYQFMKFKLDQKDENNYNVYEPKINLVQSSAVEGTSVSAIRYTHCKITIPIPQQYIYYLYHTILSLIGIEIIQFTICVDLHSISSPKIIILLLWSTLFAFHKYINYALPPKTFLDYTVNCAYLLSIYNVIANENNNKCIKQNGNVQIIRDDINVNTIYRFARTRECDITLGM